MKPKLIRDVGMFLFEKGYTVKNIRGCFDILARRNNQILLIKILEDANSINPEYAVEMAKISGYIKASPLIVSEKAGNKLEDYIVYARFGIYTLNFSTFKNCVDNKFPFVKSTKAGPIVQIVGDKLREMREKENISLKSLAARIGVSPRMIVKYENENAEITINKALRIYELFGHAVFDKIDVFSAEKNIVNEPESDVSRKFFELGFETIETKKFFDVIAKKQKEIILTEVGDRVKPELHTLSRLIDADNLVIFKHKRPKEIPSLTKEEFMDFEKANELIRFLREFE